MKAIDTIEKELTTRRMPYIDVAKGLLILCVVIGHVINSNYGFTLAVKCIIYSFHMPAFFIISGILIRKEKLSEEACCQLVMRSFKRLLVPYVLFEVFGGVLQMILYGTKVVNFTGIVYGILTIHCHVGADWFLPTLFFAETMFFFSGKRLGKKYLLLAGVLCMLLAFYIPEGSYFVGIVRRIFIAYGYIVIGYVYKEYFLINSKKGLLLSCVLLIAIAYFNGVVDLSARIFHNPALYLVAGIVGTYMILNFSVLIKGIMERVLISIGRESLLIMGTHQHIMICANCLVGSVYSLPVQATVLCVIFIYELLLICFKKKYTKLRNSYINRGN